MVKDQIGQVAEENRKRGSVSRDRKIEAVHGLLMTFTTSYADISVAVVEKRNTRCRLSPGGATVY